MSETLEKTIVFGTYTQESLEAVSETAKSTESTMRSHDTGAPLHNLTTDGSGC